MLSWVLGLLKTRSAVSACDGFPVQDSRVKLKEQVKYQDTFYHSMHYEARISLVYRDARASSSRSTRGGGGVSKILHATNNDVPGPGFQRPKWIKSRGKRPWRRACKRDRARLSLVAVADAA